jgi:hypothetical protein
MCVRCGGRAVYILNELACVKDCHLKSPAVLSSGASWLPGAEDPETLNADNAMGWLCPAVITIGDFVKVDAIDEDPVYGYVERIAGRWVAIRQNARRLRLADKSVVVGLNSASNSYVRSCEPPDKHQVVLTPRNMEWGGRFLETYPNGDWKLDGPAIGQIVRWPQCVIVPTEEQKKSLVGKRVGLLTMSGKLIIRTFTAWTGTRIDHEDPEDVTDVATTLYEDLWW